MIGCVVIRQAYGLWHTRTSRRTADLCTIARLIVFVRLDYQDFFSPGSRNTKLRVSEAEREGQGTGQF